MAKSMARKSEYRPLYSNTIMKNLENSALMQEMNVNEMQEVNGGWVALALAVAGAAIYVYNNWDDFCVGVNEGWNGTRN